MPVSPGAVAQMKQRRPKQPVRCIGNCSDRRSYDVPLVRTGIGGKALESEGACKILRENKRDKICSGSAFCRMREEDGTGASGEGGFSRLKGLIMGAAARSLATKHGLDTAHNRSR